MNMYTFIRDFSVAVACFGMLIPQAALAAAPNGPASPAGQGGTRVQSSVIRDIALRPGGVLVGQIVTVEGTAQAKAPVSLQQNGKELVRTVTDANGLYAIKGLRGGVYHVVSRQTVETYRLWSPDTAPPAAKDAALMVEGNGVVRGQLFGGILANPWVLTAVIATAIAVPIAISNKSNGPSS